MSTDYPLLGPPSISLAAFTHVLQAAGSPAASEASGIYAAFVKQGVDPAIGLAIAQHESSFGKAGIAVGRKNLFGNRYYASQASVGATNAGGWGKFPTYAANAAYEAALLAGPLYGGSSRFNTARTFPFRYAPTSDGNAPTNYGSSIVAAITKWGGSGAIAYHPSTGAAAHVATAKPKTAKGAKAAAVPVRSLHASAKAHPKAAAATAGLGAGIILLLIL